MLRIQTQKCTSWALSRHFYTCGKTRGFSFYRKPGWYKQYLVFIYLSAIQVKEWMRLSTTVGTSKPVLALKNTLFDRAGVPNFVQELRNSQYWVDQRSNARYRNDTIHLDTRAPVFVAFKGTLSFFWYMKDITLLNTKNSFTTPFTFKLADEFENIE